MELTIVWVPSLERWYVYLKDADIEPLVLKSLSELVNTLENAGFAIPSQTRDSTFRVRMTDKERADLATRAEVAGQSQSEYVRRLIWPPQN